MSIFSHKGFDSLIGTNTEINAFDVKIADGTRFVVDGKLQSQSISILTPDTTKATGKACLVVNGRVQVSGTIEVADVIITGQVAADEVIVAGTLAVKKGASLFATRVVYKTLVIEPGALINAHLTSITGPVDSTTIAQ